MADNDVLRARPEMLTDHVRNEDLFLQQEVLETIEQLIDGRRRQFLAFQRAQDQVLQDLAVGPEQVRRQEEVAQRIFEKLNISSEAEELAQLWRERHERISDATERLDSLLGDDNRPPEQQERQ